MVRGPVLFWLILFYKRARPFSGSGTVFDEDISARLDKRPRSGPGPVGKPPFRVCGEGAFLFVIYSVLIKRPPRSSTLVGTFGSLMSHYVLHCADPKGKNNPQKTDPQNAGNNRPKGAFGGELQ